MDLSLEDMAKQLNESQNYKVLKYFQRIERYFSDNNEKKFIGVYLDIEATGLNTSTDKIIEIALIPFEYTIDGRIYRVFEGYSSYQDPGIPIPKEITSITGITDDMVKGHNIDLATVKEIIDGADLIIAHNTTFDRKIFERQLFETKNKIWACSLSQIPWKEEGIGSAKLEYIAFVFGFFYKAHRAEIDCLVGIHILSQVLPVSKEPVLKTLLKNAMEKSYRIWAVNAYYESKDALKARRYKWNDGSNNQPRAWYIEVSELKKEGELNFLYKDVYKKQVQLPIDEIDPFSHFL